MSLTSLPAELLQQICQCVRDSDILYFGAKESSGTKGFRSLALSCRLLYKIALPFLYYSPTLDPQRMFLLLRSIIETPNLVLEIKDVTIHGEKTGECELDLGKAYTVLRKPGLLPKYCTRYLHPNDRKVITALVFEGLLIQLCHVERLSIYLNDFPKDFILLGDKRWKSEHRASLSQLVPALRELDIFMVPSRFKQMQAAKLAKESLEAERPSQDHEGMLQEDDRQSGDDDMEPVDSEEDDALSEERVDILSQIQYLMELSKPQDLCIETEFVLPYSCPWLRLPSVVTVTISCEGMYTEDFEQLLQSCPGVRSLDYYSGEGGLITDELDTRLNVRRIIRALQYRQHELESLAMSFHRPDDGIIVDHDTITDMRHLSRLTTLALDGDFLFDLPQGTGHSSSQNARVGFIDKIPRSLETLWVLDAYEKHLDEMKSLAYRKARDLPKLKNLTLDCWKEGAEDQFKELRDELTKAGIELVIVASPEVLTTIDIQLLT